LGPPEILCLSACGGGTDLAAIALVGILGKEKLTEAAPSVDTASCDVPIALKVSKRLLKSVIWGWFIDQNFSSDNEFNARVRRQKSGVFPTVEYKPFPLICIFGPPRKPEAISKPQ
jgi:hypothetical protein